MNTQNLLSPCGAGEAGLEPDSTKELIEAARSGRIVILTQNGGDEDEGILVLPAQLVTPDAVNFMATYAGGIVCLAMTEERIKALAIPPMPIREGDTRSLPHAASIEARLGVTTGISAADRALTIQVAINPASVPEDLVSPGHVFPCSTRNGGVLVRAAFAEASVDLARLSGLNPSAVVCKVLDDDGEMARGPTLRQFAVRHGLPIGTISDLVAYRRRTEKLVEHQGSEPFECAIGRQWTLHRYRDTVDDREILALVKGKVNSDRTLVRVHTVSMLDDVLVRAGERAALVPAVMEAIDREGSGVLLLMPAANHRNLPGAEVLREYGLGAQVLNDLGARRIVLLKKSNRDRDLGLEGFGLELIESRAL